MLEILRKMETYIESWRDIDRYRKIYRDLRVYSQEFWRDINRYRERYR